MKPLILINLFLFILMLYCFFSFISCTKEETIPEDKSCSSISLETPSTSQENNFNILIDKNFNIVEDEFIFEINK